MDSCEQLHTHKFDNSDEMGQFLKKYKLLQLTQYEIDYWNSFRTSKRTEFLILKVSP